MDVFEHYAVVPAGDDSLLVGNGSLPCVRGELWRQPDVIDALAPVIGRPTYLRVAARAKTADGRSLRLHVFDAAAGGGRRVPLEEAAALAPAELRPALERWTAEQRGAPVPALRPAWARPGWHAEAEAWAGVELRPVRLWPLSAVLRGEAAEGTVFFKAVFPLFRHEPAITEALGREHPRAVPELLAVQHERGWMLMRELPGTHAQEIPPARWAPAFAAMGAIQRAWAGRQDELLGLGAQDRGLAALAAEVAGTPALERCLERLSALDLPATIGHGDFHGGNVSITEDGRAVVFDWSDACVNHPLFDLALILQDVADEQVRRDLVEAWAQGWGADTEMVLDALPLADALSCVHQAVSYRAITASVEPDDRSLFEREEAGFLEGAVRRAKAC